MTQLTGQSIPKEKFLLLSVNLLHRAFVEAARTDAKNLFKRLAQGSAAPLTTVQMEDDSTVRFSLALDGGEFPGKLNYGAFRASLTTLISNIGRTLEESGEVTVFNAESGPHSIIFGITAVTVEDNKPTVMVLGADTAVRDAAVTLRLIYLDPGQFADRQVTPPSSDVT